MWYGIGAVGVLLSENQSLLTGRPLTSTQCTAADVHGGRGPFGFSPKPSTNSGGS